MGARRRVSAVLVSACALACVLGAGATAAFAEGSFQFGPPGAEAEQISFEGGAPRGMAVDGARGLIYVTDTANERVDEFDQAGKFVLAWGWGVATGAGELQTCTTSCRHAVESERGTGALCSPNGVAVDPGSGDVYVVSFCEHRVEKFNSEGTFLLMFGGHVNKDGTNVCAAGEECQPGSEGTGDGEFEWSFHGGYIAVGPLGEVFIGDKARVQVFEETGAFKESISLSALSEEGKVWALAVNSSGDVFLKDTGVPGVHEFESGGLDMELPTNIDSESESIESLALDRAGDLFITDTGAGPRFLKYGPAGEELQSFAASPLVYTTPSMAFDAGLGSGAALLQYGTDNESATGYGHFGVWAFAPPPEGPLVVSETAKPEPRGGATLKALVNPEGSPTEVSFEYVDEAQFKESGYAHATSTEAVALKESGFTENPEEEVNIQLPQGTLTPGVTYHFRAVAHNSVATNRGPDQSFQETPPALIEGPSASSVTSVSATLSAQINPLGASTTYELQYGRSTAYEEPALTGSVGEGESPVPISRHVQGLTPGTTYHYRLITESEVGKVESADHTFTTQLPSGELTLPDGRAWELVSPPNKGGALIESIEAAQAAADGGGIAYGASEPIGENIEGHGGSGGNFNATQKILSTRDSRTPTGWRTRDISPKVSFPPEEEEALGLTGPATYDFAPDLSLTAFEPQWPYTQPYEGAGGPGPTLYLRNNASETYQPLVTATNVPPGTKWRPAAKAGSNEEQMKFLAASPDLTHVVFADPFALTGKAITSGHEQNLYEWGAGQVALVNILPGQESSTPGAAFGANNTQGADTGASPWAMSSDGRWIVFRYGQLTSTNNWYVRDMLAGKTVAFGRPQGHTDFQTMSRDGSRLFYLEPESGAESEGELYVLDPATGATTNLTADHLDGEHSAHAQNTLLGMSEDGSYVYFVARGVLASGAVPGQNNLYLLHDNGAEWTTTLVATLSNGDERGWQPGGDNTGTQLSKITSRVSPNGRYVTFMSDRSLTGYDNTDARSGQPDEEVYLYDVAVNRLVCASCNPTGARPIGVHDVRNESPLMDGSVAWTGQGEPLYEESGRWLAAILAPDWHVVSGPGTNVAVSRPRFLSNGGRLFFDSSDALVPQDTNGLADVYEYEPAGVGGCTSGSSTFSERSGGCVSLISSGQSATESTFFDASESGDDVFFITTSRLMPEDTDTSYDIYDAHVCSAALPCHTASASAPPCTSGDSCKPAPSAQPEIFGPGASETFSGTGNIPPPTTTAKPKALTRAQKLSRALKTCRKKYRRSSKKRLRCERKAHRTYAARANTKGGRR